MKTRQPLKRHQALQPLSREHHQGLLLCWKIRMGMSKGIEPARIKRYANWFYEHHLMPHFEMEEQHIFPILGEAHELVKKAIAEHRRLGRLFKKETDLEKTLNRIEEELQQHIRFEERVLFTEIQKIASESSLKKIESLHHETVFQDNLEDEFWAHQK